MGVCSAIGMALMVSLVLNNYKVFRQGYFVWVLPVLALIIIANVALDIVQTAGWLRRNVNEPFQLLIGPVLYFYLQYLNKDALPTRRKALHFIPFMLATLIFVSVLMKAFLSVPLVSMDHSILWLLSVVAYAQLWGYYFLCRKALAQYKTQLMQSCSGIEKLSESWISNALIALLFGHSCLTVIYLLNHGPASISTNQALAVIFALLACYISYSSLRFSLAFATQPEPVEPSRYEKSGLAEQDATNILKRLQEFMQQEKPYLDPDLKIASLAQQLEVSVHHLSQVINSDHTKRKGQNFYDFVNAYRVQEVISLFDNPAYDEENILNIALDAGFTSKATFNRVFKKHTDKTPLAYRQEQKSKK